MIGDLRRLVHGRVEDGEEALETVSADFGGVVQRRPRVVVRPADGEDVVQTVRYAAARSLTLTTRGSGLSQGGQSLSDGGILLDMTGLSDAVEIDEADDAIRVQAGTPWHRVVQATLERGLLPPVRTYTLRPTVGGTLSIGGIGASSFLRGLQIDHCLDLDLVTGTGEHVRCSRDAHADLFRFALGGLGQMGVILSARLSVLPCGPLVRIWRVTYPDAATLLGDLERLAISRQAHYLAGSLYQASARQTYFLATAREIERERGLEGYEAIAGVRGQVKDVRTVPTGAFVLHDRGLAGSRAAPALRQSGETYPGLYGFLPWLRAGEFLRASLACLPASVPMQVLLYPLRRLERFPMLPLPEAESLLGCGFLTVLPEQSRQEGLAALSSIDRLLLQHGGCRYPGDYFHLGRERWRSHLGGGWDEFQRMKQANDPAGILNPQISTHQQDQQETRAMR